MSDIKLVSWGEIFLKTMDETDPERLAELLPRAELAVFKRQQELRNCPQNDEELSTLCVASEALRIVRGNNWRELYRAALLEFDMEKLGDRVEAAQAAIHARISLDGDIPSDERIAIRDAVNALTVFKPGTLKAGQDRSSRFQSPLSRKLCM